LRVGVYDAIVGINLLREGLDLPEVSLVAILDADSEGFLRSDTSLIQTMGRAARNVSGQVIMYADKFTDSMARAIDETSRRRKIQLEYNREHGIVPETIRKEVREILAELRPQRADALSSRVRIDAKRMSKMELHTVVASLEEEMLDLAAKLEFEKAAEIRDMIRTLKRS